MESSARDFLLKLLETPSPSGYERPVQDVVRAYVADFADRVTTDLHGNVIAAKNPDAKFRVMLAGHCDQIGMLISHFNDNGFLHAQTIGGWDAQQLIGQRMTIWTGKGPLPAVISRKPIHLLSDEERKQVVKLEDLWLDIGAKNKEEAESLVRLAVPDVHNRTSSRSYVCRVDGNMHCGCMYGGRPHLLRTYPWPRVSTVRLAAMMSG